MKNQILCILCFLIINCAAAQSYKLTGNVQDIKSGRGLSFATIKIIDGSNITTSDNNGDYIIKLDNGYYKLITSYIGYFSDTESIYIDNKDIVRDIFLKSTEIFTEEIEVIGEDPAYDILRKAIKYKKEFMRNLNEYNYDAYSKFILRTNLAIEDKDTSNKSDKLPILGILESETKGYFKKPDLEKQIVKSKRETANITRGVAIPLILNFYDEKIDLGEVKIPGPVADDALDEYEYKLIATTSMDSTKVFKIKVTNSSNLTPQFYGNIYIIDSTFALIKIDLQSNDAGNLRGFDKLNFKQKFSNFIDKKKNNFWMPTDVQIYANGSFAGLIKFQGEVYTVVSNYILNEKAPPGIFDDIIIKVLPDASGKDSSYWVNNQLIKSSNEETKAFRKIEKDTEKKNKSFSLTPFSLNYGKNLSLSLFELYRFNRVEGHQLKTKINYSKDFNKLIASAYYAYGFSDKKSKYELNTRFRLLNDKSLFVNAGVFNRLNTLFREPYYESVFENTLSSLFYKKDEYNYFYENGFNLSLGKSIIPQLRLTALYEESKQTSAFKNTDYSFFKKSNLFNENPLINEAFKRSIGFSLRIDPNIYKGIDWGTGEITKFPITEYPSLTFRFDYSGKRLNSTFENRTFSLNFAGHNYFNSFLNVEYKIGGITHAGEVPYQDLAYFGTSFLGFAESMSFYTMDYNEYLGDKIFFFNIENNFGKLLWGNIPVLKSLDLITFLNIGRSETTESNTGLTRSKEIFTTNGIYMETGFGIDRILEFLRLNFAWRLNNHKDGRNFILTLVLQ